MNERTLHDRLTEVYTFWKSSGTHSRCVSGSQTLFLVPIYLASVSPFYYSVKRRESFRGSCSDGDQLIATAVVVGKTVAVVVIVAVTVVLAAAGPASAAEEEYDPIARRVMSRTSLHQKA